MQKRTTQNCPGSLSVNYHQLHKTKSALPQKKKKQQQTLPSPKTKHKPKPHQIIKKNPDF